MATLPRRPGGTCTSSERESKRASRRLCHGSAKQTERKQKHKRDTEHYTTAQYTIEHTKTHKQLHKHPHQHNGGGLRTARGGACRCNTMRHGSGWKASLRKTHTHRERAAAHLLLPPPPHPSPSTLKQPSFIPLRWKGDESQKKKENEGEEAARRQRWVRTLPPRIPRLAGERRSGWV